MDIHTLQVASGTVFPDEIIGMDGLKCSKTIWLRMRLFKNPDIVHWFIQQ